MMTHIEGIDIFSEAFRANPYPAYQQLREAAPVFQVQIPNGPDFFLVSRYRDVFALLKDERFVKNRASILSAEPFVAQPLAPNMPEVLAPLANTILDMDGADHARLRSLIHKGFTPRFVENMRPRIQTICDTLLDAVQEKGEMDFISSYAFALPITVIAEILGVPVEDRDQFRAWSRVLVTANLGDSSPERLGPITEFVNYIIDVIAQRRAAPKDDLISALVQIEEAGDKLSQDELVSMVFILLVAGHETTVNLIGNGTLALLRQPDQFEKLKNNPSLTKTAVEELLRYDSPIQLATERYATEDLEIAGVRIPKGAMVLGGLGSANHDPEQFANPGMVDVTRADNKHVAFGQGVHYCVGAPLARLEGQIAFTTLLRRLPNLHLTVDPETLAWRSSLFLRGLDEMPVAF
jgi:cytochrome P450 PksS